MVYVVYMVQSTTNLMGFDYITACAWHAITLIITSLFCYLITASLLISWRLACLLLSPAITIIVPSLLL